MTDEEQKLNWYTIISETGSMPAVHNLREYIKELEKENAEFKEALNNHPDTASVTQLMELIQVREENKRLTKELEEIKTCPRCVSHHLPKEMYPCSDCVKDGVLTKWH